MNTYFSAPLPAHVVQAQIGLESVRNALVSLSWLGKSANVEHPWLTQTYAQLSIDERQLHSLIFGPFSSTLLAKPMPNSFPAYLDVLAERPAPEWLAQIDMADLTTLEVQVKEKAERLLSDAAALKAQIIAHLRMLWDKHLAHEWQNEARELKALTAEVQWRVQNQPEWANRSALEIAQAWLQRDLPAPIAAQIDGARQIIFVLSPHVDLVASRFGSPDTVWVFSRFDRQTLRREPLKRAEVLGGLAALADDTRLRILELLAEHEEMRAQDIVSRLTIAQSNVSRHLKLLTGAGFVNERRSGDANKWYRLNREGLARTFNKTTTLLTPEHARAVSEWEQANAELRAVQATAPVAVRHLIIADGRVRWSNNQTDNNAVLDYLLSYFEVGHNYTEKEVNDILRQRYADKDHVFIRRELINTARLSRTPDGARYWRER
jgi:DNA-binding transcriptional ArsR family regulator